MRSTPTSRTAAAILALAIAGCGAARRPRTAELPSHLPIAHAAKPPGAPGASITILTPAPGSEQSRAITARVAVHHFALVKATASTKPHAGHGHLHFILDGGRYDEPQFSGVNGQMALRLAANGYYSPAYKPSITYKHIPAGRHTLQVELVNLNEEPTGISATVHFSVR